MKHRDRTAPKSPGRLFIFGAITLTLSALSALVVLEGAVRLMAPQQLIAVVDIFEPADSVGWRFKPDLDIKINTGEGEVRLVTDAHGFRTGPGPETGTRPRVLLLGDSFMAAIQVEYEETFAAHIERGVSSSTGQSASVRNTSIGGWDPPQYLIQSRRTLEKDTFDLVVVSVYLGNDIVHEAMEIRTALEPPSIHEFRFPRSMSAAEWLVALAKPIDDRLKRRSHLYIWTKIRLDYLRMRLGLSAAYFPDVHLRSLAESPRWDYTADILEKIHDFASGMDIPTLFILIPSHFQVDRSALDQHVAAFRIDAGDVLIDQPNEILSERMRGRGLEVLDPLPEFRRHFEAGMGPLFGSVDTHFNADGHKLLWELVGERITEVLEKRTIIAEEPDA